MPSFKLAYMYELWELWVLWELDFSVLCILVSIHSCVFFSFYSVSSCQNAVVYTVYMIRQPYETRIHTMEVRERERALSNKKQLLNSIKHENDDFFIVAPRSTNIKWYILNASFFVFFFEGDDQEMMSRMSNHLFPPLWIHIHRKHDHTEYFKKFV